MEAPRSTRTRRRVPGTAAGTGIAGASAESRKRRVRHVIWDLEDEISRLQGVLQAEEQRRDQLQRQMELLTHAVRAREVQAERLKTWGTGRTPSSSAAVSQTHSPEASPLRSSSSQLLEPQVMGLSGLPQRGGVDSSMMAFSLAAAGSGSLDAWGAQPDLQDLLTMGRQQLVAYYKQATEALSPLLFLAEDPAGSGSGAADSGAMARLEAAVHELRTTGSIVKVCNTAAVLAVAQPVAPNLEPAGDAHWAAVASALLLTPRQVEDITTLNTLRTRWHTRITREQQGVGESLETLLREEAGSMNVRLWRVDSGGATAERKLDLLARSARLVGAAAGVVLLADELLLGGGTAGLLTPIQVARLMVHSYPYVPDSCAIIAAVARSAQPGSYTDMGGAAAATHTSVGLQPCSRATSSGLGGTSSSAAY